MKKCSYCDFTGISNEVIGKHQGICEHNPKKEIFGKRREKREVLETVLNSSSLKEINSNLFNYLNKYYSDSVFTERVIKEGGLSFDFELFIYFNKSYLDNELIQCIKEDEFNLSYSMPYFETSFSHFLHECRIPISIIKYPKFKILVLNAFKKIILSKNADKENENSIRLAFEKEHSNIIEECDHLKKELAAQELSIKKLSEFLKSLLFDKEFLYQEFKAKMKSNDGPQLSLNESFQLYDFD